MHKIKIISLLKSFKTGSTLNKILQQDAHTQFTCEIEFFFPLRWGIFQRP